MRSSALRIQSFEGGPTSSMSTKSLQFYLDGWIADCEYRRHTPPTIETNKTVIEKLLWFLQREGYEACDTTELRAFLNHLNNGHKEPGGRWGNLRLKKQVSATTVDTYYGRLKTFFQWILDDGALDVSPMAKIKRPVCRADQIKPMAAEQIEALIAACKHTNHPIRNRTIIWLLYDSGIRVTEICTLTRADLDLTTRHITVMGKGQKRRSVYFGRKATKALWAYLKEHSDIADWEPLFQSEVGKRKGLAMQRRGLGDMVERLGKAAGITGVRCSPHTIRHSSSISFLRAGGTIEQLRERLGHTSLKMTLKYVQLAEADLAGQRQFSPADRLNS